ncbi:hypothetical protein FA95DRAFT_1561878 [Auriscalpium vulgare]|uniref:Uncharacterized protein n=1 Tax=Auriscalpium vulgare TaxID=40419 RepID=A0ACB8RMC4_9AGAM|nr:hypothetical protein FA95DRAFT_1561878 [Auriscalpium vulgare]
MSTFPSNVFSLSPDLVATLTPRSLISQRLTSSDASEPPVAQITSSGARACNICLGVAFLDVDEQRAHFRSDWHRYNVKLRLKGGKPIAEPDFVKLVDGLEDSLSGSASSSDEGGSDDSDAVQNALRKTKVSSRTPSPTSGPRVPLQPLAWFHAPPATQIGVYRSIFADPSSPESYLEELKALQKDHGAEGRKWAMFMTAGGHFAGLVARVSQPDAEEEEPQPGKKKKAKKPKTDTEVLLHKTFHRYTTRRKQGGSQSVNDNAKGPAKSAGAQLRRYGEQALRDDIRNLLTEWAEEINQCERIWIRASVSNRRIFLDYDEAVIAKGDPRLRTFPFPTRRPTQSELSRCLLELTKVKISHLTEDALRAQDEAYLASLPKPKPKPQPTSEPPPIEKEKVSKLSKEEEAVRDKWTRLLDMVTRGRLDALKAFWERENANLGGIDAPIPAWTGERCATLLQLAARLGQEEVTGWLLDDALANPTIDVPSTATTLDTSPSDGEDDSRPAPAQPGARRTAYDLAASRTIRDVFRRSAGAHPERWDWLGAARVPSALSKEMEEGREERKKVRRKGLKEKVREREAKEREKGGGRESPVEEPVVKARVKTVEDVPGAPRKLGGSAGAADAIAGLTPEMRAKVERERRARAAEARLKALGR